jgi:hypothetical protein
MIIAWKAEFWFENMNVSGWKPQSITWQGFLSELTKFYVCLGRT